MSAVAPPAAPFVYTDVPVFRITVGQYHELADAGILTEDDPVELLEGVLVYKMPRDPAHVGTVGATRDVIRPLLPPGWRYRAEQPVILPDGEPEPDGLVATGMDADNFVRHPSSGDVAVVIEVANSTLDNDRGIKLRSYARAGIPVYWIVNLIARQVEAYTDPDPSADPHPTYRGRAVYSADATVPLSVGGVDLPAVPVAAVLPPPAESDPTR